MGVQQVELTGKFGFPFTNLQPGDWPLVLQVNVMGMVNVTHALAPHLVQQTGVWLGNDSVKCSITTASR